MLSRNRKDERTMADMVKKPITLDVNHMMADTLGFQYGIARSQVE